MRSSDVTLELLSVRWELSAQVRSTVVRAGCGRTCGGRRAGKHVKARRHCNTYSETSDGKSHSCQQPVDVVVTRRRAVSVNARCRSVTRDDPLYYDRQSRQWRTAAHPFFSQPSIYVINAVIVTDRSGPRNPYFTT